MTIMRLLAYTSREKCERDIYGFACAPLHILEIWCKVPPCGRDAFMLELCAANSPAGGQQGEMQPVKK